MKRTNIGKWKQYRIIMEKYHPVDIFLSSLAPVQKNINRIIKYRPYFTLSRE